MRETKARRKAVISKKSDPSKLSGLVSKRKSQINIPSMKKGSGLSRSRVLLPKMDKESKNKLKKNSKVSKSLVFSKKKPNETSKGKPQFKSPAHKNFFEIVKEDQEKIHQFMNQSEVQEKMDGDHIVKIIEKTKKREERFNKKLVDEKMKVRLVNLKNNTSLIDIRNRMQQDNQEEVRKLKNKNKDLVQELNKVTDVIRQQKNQIHQLKNTLDNTRVPTNEEYKAFLDLKQGLGMKGMTMHEKYISQKKFEDRMIKITKICELNQIQNEECIRKLNFYQGNLDKAIEEQQRIIDKIKQEDEDLEEKRLRLVDEYNIRRYEHHELLNGIGEEIKMKQYIDANVATTNFLINESVRLKKNEIKHKMIEQIERENKLKEMRDNQIKTQKVADDLDRMREANEIVAVLFEEGDNGESWSEKPQMKETVVEIERKKDLERYKLEKKTRLEDIENENKRLEEELKTLQEANKGQDLSQYDNNYVQGKHDEVCDKIAKEKKVIEKCEESLKTLNKISEQTNLIISSIGRNCGVETGENELEILHEVGVLTSVRNLRFT